MGYDLKLIKMVSEKVNSPILALGGAGNWQHMLDLLSTTDISNPLHTKYFSFYGSEYIFSKKKFFKR